MFSALNTTHTAPILLPGHNNFFVNRFIQQTYESLHSLSLDRILQSFHRQISDRTKVVNESVTGVSFSSLEFMYCTWNDLPLILGIFSVGGGNPIFCTADYFTVEFYTLYLKKWAWGHNWVIFHDTRNDQNTLASQNCSNHFSSCPLLLKKDSSYMYFSPCLRANLQGNVPLAFL